MKRCAWRECQLGDIITLRRGFDLPQHLREDGPFPVVSSSGITGYHREARVAAPGVVTGRYGTLGRVFFMRQDFWPLNTSLYVTDFKGNHPRFVAYLLETLPFATQNVAGAVPGVNRNYLHRLRVRVPPLPVQRRIAAILGAYDDLIENNLRRIRILEEMAQALYREWFVNFRFPGHEKVPLVDSPIGGVPRGWKVVRVGDVLEVRGGGTPSKKIRAYWDNGTITWYVPSDLTKAGTMFMERSGTRITVLGLHRSSAQLFPAYCVMMTSRATIGVVAINTTPACTNQGFITCLPNDRVPLYYVYHWLRENVPLFTRLASGATFKEISKGVFRRVHLLLPPIALVRDFEVYASTFAHLILALQRTNVTLADTRDLLVQPLLSGSIHIGTGAGTADARISP